MESRIVKVQLPVAGTKPAILIYDESREFCVIVEDPDSFDNISQSQDGALRAYWHADLDFALLTFHLKERAPEQEW